MTGERFGSLVVRGIYRPESGTDWARCACDCGGSRSVRVPELTRARRPIDRCRACERSRPRRKRDGEGK